MLGGYGNHAGGEYAVNMGGWDATNAGTNAVLIHGQAQEMNENRSIIVGGGECGSFGNGMQFFEAEYCEEEGGDASDDEGSEGGGTIGSGDEDSDDGESDSSSDGIYDLPENCTIVDGRNVEDSYNSGSGTYGHIWAFSHEVVETIQVNAIQIHTGNNTLDSRVAVWDGSGSTPESELFGADFMTRDTIGWQGARLDTTYDLDPQDIWVTWHTISGLPSLDSEGSTSRYMWSNIGTGDWNGPYTGQPKYRLLYCD